MKQFITAEFWAKWSLRKTDISACCILCALQSTFRAHLWWLWVVPRQAAWHTVLSKMFHSVNTTDCLLIT